MSISAMRRRFTADEYQRMGRVGILPEGSRVELVDGEVLAVTPVGTRHNACVGFATRELVRATGDLAIVFPQCSVRLGAYSEPQPDLVVLRPRQDFYASRHAGPDDIIVIIEIADASLRYDRGPKARLYAAAGISEYWLADLNENVVLRHTSPEGGLYRSVEASHRGQTIAPALLPNCRVLADVFLIE